MSQYTPERWVVLEFNNCGDIIRKVFGGWYGGYLGSDSWKLSSGITEVREFDDRFEFDNLSGSTYICYKCAYGMGGYNSSVLAGWQRQVNEGARITITIVEEFDKGE